MEILFTDLKEKEVVNVYDGKKLGRIIDLVFDIQTGKVIGIVVPGERKIFRRADDIFVPLEKLKRIGDDVIFFFHTCSRKYSRVWRLFTKYE